MAKKKTGKFSSFLNNPIDLYASKTMKLDYLEDRLVTSYKNLLDRKKARLNLVLTKRCFSKPQVILDKKKHDYLLLINKLDALSPLKTLDRGYSIIKHNNKTIGSVKDLKSSDKIEIELKDGSIEATII